MRGISMTGTVLLALGGCGQGTPEAGGGNSAGSAVGSYATPGGRAEVRAGDAALSGLPEGIPPYPRADSRGAIQFGGPTEEGEARVMGFQTADPPTAVAAFYAEAGARAGFRLVERRDTPAGAILALERDNGDVMNVTATGTPRGTQVQIMAGQERPRR